MSTTTLAQPVIDTYLKDVPAPTFNAKDRCDRCGAQAYVKHTIKTETPGDFLLWCSHHAKAYRPIMESQGILLKSHSETDRLKEDRKKGSEN